MILIKMARKRGVNINQPDESGYVNEEGSQNEMEPSNVGRRINEDREDLINEVVSRVIPAIRPIFEQNQAKEAAAPESSRPNEMNETAT